MLAARETEGSRAGSLAHRSTGLQEQGHHPSVQWRASDTKSPVDLLLRAYLPRHQTERVSVTNSAWGKARQPVLYMYLHSSCTYDNIRIVPRMQILILLQHNL